jgi:hypothetical protein
LNPQKNCGFSPYLMFLIEDVTGRSFPKEGIHMSQVDEFAASIFGDPNPSMASSSHKSLHHSTMPPFFDSSIYTGPGSH